MENKTHQGNGINIPFSITCIDDSDKKFLGKIFPKKVMKTINRKSFGKSLTGGYYVNNPKILETLVKKVNEKRAAQTMSTGQQRISDDPGDDDVTPQSLLSRMDKTSIKSVFSTERKNPKHTRVPIHHAKIKRIVFPEKHLLNIIDKPGVDVDPIVKIFGSQNVTAVSSCSAHFLPLIRKFATAHRRFSYYHLLNGLAKEGVRRYQDDIAKKTVNRFFSTILNKVVPLELFGSSNNFKKVKRAVFMYIHDPMRRLFLIQNVALQLELKEIGWLDDVMGDTPKFNLLSQFLAFFIKQYINVVMNTYICQVSTSHSIEKVCMLKHNFLKRRDEFIDNMKANESLQEYSFPSLSKVPLAELTLHLKPETMRPIYKSIPIEDDAQAVDCLKQVLSQAWLMKAKDFTLSDLYPVWNNVTESIRKNDLSLYYVSCDIQDAYGSVRHDKLIEILDDLLDNLPTSFTMKSFATWKRLHGYRLDHKNQICDASVPLLFSSKTLNSPSNNGKEDVHVKLKWVKDKVKSYILNQLVLVKTDEYRLAQGVGQGFPLCGILANIYYGTMELKEMNKFRKHGILIRYMDDFLYLTEKKNIAIEFLALVEKGLPEYNCHFKPSKTHTNLPPKCETAFSFLGYRFNAKTLEIEPEPSEPPSKYNTTVYPVGSDYEKHAFEQRALGGNRVQSRLVLSPTINSLQTIKKILMGAARLQAQRIRILIVHMLRVEFADPQLIMTVIDKAVKMLLHRAQDCIFKSSGFRFRTLRIHIWQKFFIELRKIKTLPNDLIENIRKKATDLKERPWILVQDKLNEFARQKRRLHSQNQRKD